MQSDIVGILAVSRYAEAKFKALRVRGDPKHSVEHGIHLASLNALHSVGIACMVGPLSDSDRFPLANAVPTIYAKMVRLGKAIVLSRAPVGD